MSNPEKLIADILWKENIPYEKEKTFSDLKEGKFRFDFYLSQQNIIIEYNGEQHYQNIWNDRSKFMKGQEHDRRKISYCLANNITIYCIPYWELSKLTSAADLLNFKYIAKSRWKNDEDWSKYQHHEY